MILDNFHSLRPPHETNQEETLEWFIEAHCRAEKGASDEFKTALKEKFWHVGCKPDRIAKRGHVLADYLHRDWNQMEIYRVEDAPTGLDLTARMEHYQKHADQAFETYYQDEKTEPDDLIHVSCTGYASPSAAQKLVSLKQWGTTVTHAYHMGCYAAFPGLRIAQGFLAAGKNRVDLVHTELCSLHSNPAIHRTDQLVSQSLFADGYMKYSLKKASDGPHLKLLALHEEVIPESRKSMTWNVHSWGFEMTLGKEIPVLIARSIQGYLERLAKKGKKDFNEAVGRGFFAIHPGGPKILTHIQNVLGLSDRQMGYSFEVLRQFGNMSSATVPHIWEKILKDPEVKGGSLLVSMAFGPGLTVSGSLMEKIDVADGHPPLPSTSSGDPIR
ncbi:MAG: naringenin-chalcone synthase [Verrucomicrobia bacterium]|nr:naringenin-chalcone synthase [Verrucomicrobiota bacterium]